MLFAPVASANAEKYAAMATCHASIVKVDPFSASMIQIQNCSQTVRAMLRTIGMIVANPRAVRKEISGMFSLSLSLYVCVCVCS
jgi:hypothetical protein